MDTKPWVSTNTVSFKHSLTTQHARTTSDDRKWQPLYVFNSIYCCRDALHVLWTRQRAHLCCLWPSLMSVDLWPNWHSNHILTFSPCAHRSLEAFQLRHKFLSSRVPSKQVYRQCTSVLRCPGTLSRQEKDNELSDRRCALTLLCVVSV